MARTAWTLYTRSHSGMFAVLFIAGLIVVIFAVDIGVRAWRTSEWKRRWR